MYMSHFSRHTLVRPYSASWKGKQNFKDRFFCVRPGPNSPWLFHDESGSPLFPFYWTKNPRSKIRLNTFPRSDEDNKLILLLGQATPIKASEVLENEHSRKELTSLLSNILPPPFLFSLFFNIRHRAPSFWMMGSYCWLTLVPSPYVLYNLQWNGQFPHNETHIWHLDYTNADMAVPKVWHLRHH